MAKTETEAATAAHLEKAKDATQQIFAPQGIMAQAEQVKATGGAAGLLTFFENLLATWGPIVGPMLISYLQSLLHLTPQPTPPAK